MADKLATVMSKLSQLMLVALSPSATDGERVNAMRAVDRYLEGTGADGHELVERIKKPPLTEDEMREIFEAGYAKRVADEAEEQQRRQVTAAPRSFFGNNGSGGVSNLRSDGYGFDDRDRIAGGAVYKGYLWSDIAGHCAANLNRIPAKHHGFLADMAGKLGGYGTVSGAQAKYLGNLFSQYLSGRI